MGHAKILIVEDEVITASVLQNTLVDIGYDVLKCAVTASDAVSYATTLKPDLILMDIVLKGKKNGIDASKVIKEKLDIPIVFLTAYSDDDLLNKAKVTEPYAYIVKPYADCDIKAAIEISIYKHKIDQKLKNSEERFRNVAENALEWIWEVDINGKYTYSSPGIEKVLGYKPDDVLNNRFYDMFHPDNREKDKKVLFELFENRWTLREFVNSYSNKKGDLIWLLSSWMPIIINDIVSGYRGAAINITDEIQSREKLINIISKYENETLF